MRAVISPSRTRREARISAPSRSATISPHSRGEVSKPPTRKPAHVRTRGPDGNFGAVMFIEKEGFDPYSPAPGSRIGTTSPSCRRRASRSRRHGARRRDVRGARHPASRCCTTSTWPASPSWTRSVATPGATTSRTRSRSSTSACGSPMSRRWACKQRRRRAAREAPTRYAPGWRTAARRPRRRNSCCSTASNSTR